MRERWLELEWVCMWGWGGGYVGDFLDSIRVMEDTDLQKLKCQSMSLHRAAAGLLSKRVSSLCTCVFIYVFVLCCYTCLCGGELRRRFQASFLRLCSYFCLSHGLSLAWNSPYVLDWLSNEPQGPAYFCLHGRSQ